MPWPSFKICILCYTWNFSLFIVSFNSCTGTVHFKWSRTSWLGQYRWQPFLFHLLDAQETGFLFVKIYNILNSPGVVCLSNKLHCFEYIIIYSLEPSLMSLFTVYCKGDNLYPNMLNKMNKIKFYSVISQWRKIIKP